MPPIKGKPLILYIYATTLALRALLVQKNHDERERAIYYISQTLVRYELNYTSIEHTYLVVVFATQKLRHYMLNHRTHLVAKIDPLKYLLSRTALIGCLAKWVMILSEYEIQYVEKKAIKGQVIANQLVDVPIQGNLPLIENFPDESIFHAEPKSPWKLYFDKPHTSHVSGAGILFITPQGDSIPKSFGITFPFMNNIIEYEATEFVRTCRQC